MKLFRLGGGGREVNDIQNRLHSAGFMTSEQVRAEQESFGPFTDSAVRAFQQDRGLAADGIVGPDTWRSLVEASRTFGSRFLYLREPPFSGDDVAELKWRLNSLGFYSGKEDGIFNSEANDAVRQFQRNCGLEADGIVGTKTVEALVNLSRVTKPTSVAAIRESEKGLPAGGISGRRIMVDPGHGAPPDPGEIGPTGLEESEVALRIADRLEGFLVANLAVVIPSNRAGEHLTEQERASLANEQGVELVLSVHLSASGDPRAGGASSYYFASGNYHSPYGYRLANHVQDELVDRLGVPDCRAHGRAFPLLRETRMPVVIIEPAFVTNPDEEALLRDGSYITRIATAISEATRRYFQGERAKAED